MDHYLLILINICVEQWAGAPWQIILLTEMTLIGCSEFLPRRFIFADNEMVRQALFYIPDGEAMFVTRGRLDADIFAAIPAENQPFRLKDVLKAIFLC